MKNDWTALQKELIGLVDELGPAFANRAAGFDTAALFPTENYHDLRDAGLLKLCIPVAAGGTGADYQTYCLVAAQIGRYCGATALTFNMHTCSMLWPAVFCNDLKMPLTEAQRKEFKQLLAFHFERVVDHGALYAMPFSEGGENWTSRPYCPATPVAGGWRLNGRKKFASLAGAADYYSIMCTEAADGRALSNDDVMILAVSSDSPGLRIDGDWDTLGMRATSSLDLVLEDVFVSHENALMPPGVLRICLANYPHMFMLLAPTYMGISEGAYDFTVNYLRGEIEGLPPVKRRMFGTKRMGVARMQLLLEQSRSMFWRAIAEAGSFPTREEVLHCYATQYTVMENANEICGLAIRTCGGQTIDRKLPLERLYRDSRCGALMLPYTSEICFDYLGILGLYTPDEFDLIEQEEAGLARNSLWRPGTPA